MIGGEPYTLGLFDTTGISEATYRIQLIIWREFSFAFAWPSSFGGHLYLH